MSAIETAKEIVRISSTAGLSKDVIDLLDKKNSLLTEQVTTLETENANLKKKLAEL
jgi:predicted nuclease with TOPRIM domain